MLVQNLVMNSLDIFMLHLDSTRADTQRAQCINVNYTFIDTGKIFRNVTQSTRIYWTNALAAKRLNKIKKLHAKTSKFNKCTHRSRGSTVKKN